MITASFPSGRRPAASAQRTTTVFQQSFDSFFLALARLLLLLLLLLVLFHSTVGGSLSLSSPPPPPLLVVSSLCSIRTTTTTTTTRTITTRTDTTMMSCRILSSTTTAAAFLARHPPRKIHSKTTTRKRLHQLASSRQSYSNYQSSSASSSQPQQKQQYHDSSNTRSASSSSFRRKPLLTCSLGRLSSSNPYYYLQPGRIRMHSSLSSKSTLTALHDYEDDDDYGNDYDYNEHDYNDNDDYDDDDVDVDNDKEYDDASSMTATATRTAPSNNNNHISPLERKKQAQSKLGRKYSYLRRSTLTSNNNNRNNRHLTSNTGGLRKLPVVKPASEIVHRALKAVRQLNIQPDASMGNIKNRARKHGTETVNALLLELNRPLKDIIVGYQHEWQQFHPFERVVADLSLSTRELQDGVSLPVVLHELHDVRNQLRLLAQDWMARIKQAESAKEAHALRVSALQSLPAVMEELATPSLTTLRELQTQLRSSPIVALDTPAVVLVGAPNVGKSSIVRRISSATPEVNNYPFTTRGMTLGHVEVFWSDNETVAQVQASIVHRSVKQHRYLQSNPMEVPSKPPPDAAASTAATKKKKQKQNKKKKKQPNDNDDDDDDLEMARTESKDGLLGNYSFSQYCQVMDSPGLLVRSDGSDSDNNGGENNTSTSTGTITGPQSQQQPHHRTFGQRRNAMEALTLAAMEHLPTAVMFVLDLTGEAGDKCSSIDHQLQLRRELRQQFPKRPWIDVVSKYDLGIVDGALPQLEAIRAAEAEHNRNSNNNQNPYIKLSVKENIGVEELQQQVLKVLGEVRVVLDAMAAVDVRTVRPDSTGTRGSAVKS